MIKGLTVGIRTDSSLVAVVDPNRKISRDGLRIYVDNATVQFNRQYVPAVMVESGVPDNYLEALSIGLPFILVDPLALDSDVDPPVSADPEVDPPVSQELLELSFEPITIDTTGEEPCVDARDLHQRLGSKQEFPHWFDNRTEELELIKGKDFGVCLINLSSKECGVKRKGRGGHNAVDYWLTLDAAKHVAMLERNERGREIRQYLIDSEKELRKLQVAPQKLTLTELCQAYLQQEEQLKLSIATTDTITEEKDREISKLVSKVETPTKGITMKRFAKDTASVLGYSSRTIYPYLVDTGASLIDWKRVWNLSVRR